MEQRVASRLVPTAQRDEPQALRAARAVVRRRAEVLEQRAQQQLLDGRLDDLVAHEEAEADRVVRAERAEERALSSAERARARARAPVDAAAGAGAARPSRRRPRVERARSRPRRARSGGRRTQRVQVVELRARA